MILVSRASQFKFLMKTIKPDFTELLGCKICQNTGKNGSQKTQILTYFTGFQFNDWLFHSIYSILTFK